MTISSSKGYSTKGIKEYHATITTSNKIQKTPREWVQYFSRALNTSNRADPRYKHQIEKKTTSKTIIRGISTPKSASRSAKDSKGTKEQPRGTQLGQVATMAFDKVSMAQRD